MTVVFRAGRHLLWMAAILTWVGGAAAQDAQVDEPAPPDSSRALACQEFLDAFASGDAAVLREVLVAKNVRLTLPALEEERQRAVDGRFSADQAALVLVERLERDPTPRAPDLGPDTLHSADGTLAARCPIFDPTEGSVFMVIHYGLETASNPRAQTIPRTGRLYLDLHHDSTSSRWQVRAVRELR